MKERIGGVVRGYKVGFKKVILCISLFSALVFSLTDARSEENKWKFAGKTKDNNYLMYYDPSSVNYIRDTYVSLMIKRELSAEGIDRYKKNFYTSVKQAEAKAGEKIGGSSEPVLNAMIKRETKKYRVEIDCVSNKIMVPPEKTEPGEFNVVIENAIEKGTTAETMRNAVCNKR